MRKRIGVNGNLATLLLALAGLAAFAAGCGGSSGTESSGSGESGGSLTKSELIKQGDAICKKGEAALEEEANGFAKENGIDTSKPTQAQQEEVIEKVVAPALRRQAEEIRALGAPGGEEGKVEKLVDALEKGSEELEEEPGKLLQGTNPVQQASALAKEYGFKNCGSE